MIVNYYPEKEGRLGDRYLDSIRLQPGENHLSDGDYARLQRHPSLQRYLGCGAIALSPVEEPAPEVEPEPEVEPAAIAEFPASLQALTVSEASTHVAACTDLARLKIWLEECDRKSLQRLIQNRIEDLSSE